MMLQKSFGKIGRFSILAALCAASVSFGADYYVSTGAEASDVTGNGSQQSPWRTIVFSLAQIGPGSNTLHLDAGNFSEASTLVIPSGLSLIGSGRGITTIVVTAPFDLTQFPGSCSDASDVSYDNYDEKFVMQIKRASNQTIKGFSLDGLNRTCHGGIFADSVTGVVFDSIEITNFKFAGLWINYSVNCEVKNSFFKDNTFGNQANDCGEIMFYSNQRLKIHHNRIENTIHGYGIKAYSVTWTDFCTWSRWTQNWASYADSTLIYNNEIIVSETAMWTAGGNAVPCISIEFNGISMKNVQIYDNLLTNTVSLVGSYNNTGTFRSARVHHNTFTLNHEYRYALEANVPYLEFDHNFINGGFYPISQWENRSASWTDQSIHHNVFYDQQGGQVLIHYVKAPTNFKFCNNTVVDLRGIRQVFDNSTSFSSATVANNILYRPTTVTPAGTLYSGTTVKGTIKNNLFSNYTSKGTAAVIANPLFAATGAIPYPYFNLQQNSPAVDAGLVITGVTGTYVGRRPDIGAYEYGSTGPGKRAVMVPFSTVPVASSYSYFSIDGRRLDPKSLPAVVIMRPDNATGKARLSVNPFGGRTMLKKAE